MKIPKQEISDSKIPLFAEIQSGNKDAFKILFDEYYSKLLWFAARYVISLESADEIVKELFIELWQKRDKIIIRESLNAYLYASVRNRAINYLRNKNNQDRHIIIETVENEDLTLYKSPAKGPSEALEQKEFEEAIEHIVETLPGRTRLVFTLHRNDGLSYSEISEVMEISVKTVENQMARAFKILRKKIKYMLPAFVAASSHYIAKIF